LTESSVITDTLGGGALYQVGRAETMALAETNGGRFLWEIIDDTQAGNWQNINNPQTPGWSVIDNANSPGWTQIATQ
jgi:hypothetical protein